LKSAKEALQHGIENDGKIRDEIYVAESQEGESVRLGQSGTSTVSLSNEEIISIKEDLSQITLCKIRSTQNVFPTYEHVHDLQVINGQGDNPEIFKRKEYAISTSHGKMQIYVIQWRLCT